MLMRTSLFLSFLLLPSAAMFGAADSQDLSLDKPLQIPEATLQPGKYSIRLEDHLADRAIVRITDPSGADHYLLTVPSKKLSASAKGLIFFPGSGDTQVLHGWECATCKRPLEFVYPKDEAVKLTGQTGTPVLAFDPSYDKLPANLSAEDRKVVTLWLLAPKTVTADGKGEGLSAAKYSEPKLADASTRLPKKMPKTGSNIFVELAGGSVLLLSAILLMWRRKSAHAFAS